MRKLRLLLAPVLACVLLGATLAPASVGASTLSTTPITLNPSLKIHPLLQAEAQTNPTRVVRVIVQQVSAPASPGLLGGLVGGLLGSSSTTDEQFTVIPALVTNVQLSSLAAMALDPNVRYISPDGPVAIIPGLPIVGGLLNGVLGVVGGLLGGGASQPSVSGSFSSYGRGSVDASHLSTTYPFDTGAPSAWAGRAGPADTGARVTVAVLDSGVDLAHPDLKGHVIGVNVNKAASGPTDGYGHGTHVAGIIAGQDSAGQYVGLAPGANVVGVKLSDDTGATYESDVLRGLQWVSQNRAAYNIRAINLSLSASVPQSYATSPIDAAVENLWHQGVTVVASAGNLGAGEDAMWYAPGNDPLAITVGCLDDNQTVAPSDDSLCLISSRGVTEDGFAKPDLIAPGRKIVSSLASGVNGHPAVLATTFPDRITADGRHIRLSGTSMSAPMVTGAVALLLQRYPGLTPDQVKQMLVSTASGYPGQADKAGELNIVAALQASVPPATPQRLLPVGGGAPPVGAVTLLWDGTRWANTYWTGGHWEAGYWDGGHWDTTYWDAGHWDAGHWDAGYWDAGHWDAANWSAGHWDAGHWDAGLWDASSYD